MALPSRVLARMALRTSLLQATWNYERQQGIGWAYALEPALRALYPDASMRRERLAEHTAFFNTQPTLASLALGAVASLEEQRARGAGPDAAGLARVKAVLGSSLAALGDRLFWFTLRPFAACLGVLVALGGSWVGALVMWLTYNLFHQTVRLLGVGWGYREGPVVLGGALRARFEGLSRGVSLAGTALVGVMVAAVLAPGGVPRSLEFQVLLSLGLAIGLVAARRPRPSPTEWGLGFGAICLVLAWSR